MLKRNRLLFDVYHVFFCDVTLWFLYGLIFLRMCSFCFCFRGVLVGRVTHLGKNVVPLKGDDVVGGWSLFT